MAEQCLSQSQEHFSKRLGENNPITGEVSMSFGSSSLPGSSDEYSECMLQFAFLALMSVPEISGMAFVHPGNGSILYELVCLRMRQADLLRRLL